MDAPGAAGLRERARVTTAAVAAAAGVATLAPVRSRCAPAAGTFAEGAHMATQSHSLSYAGCNFLRQRLVLSTLSGRPVKIRRIRARDDNPGLRGTAGRAARRMGVGAAGVRRRCPGGRRAGSLRVPRARRGGLVARRPRTRARRGWGGGGGVGPEGRAPRRAALAAPGRW